MNKEDYQKLLRENVVEITFTKVDGTERVMKATLRAEYLPPLEDKQLGATADHGPDDVVRCWDIDKGAWRSFRTDSVKKEPQLLLG